MRHTVDNPKYFKFTIHFFGPCSAVGTFVKDDQTIESYLQNIINQNNVPCRVLNHGQQGGIIRRNINSLYRIMDMNFDVNDIVILFGVNQKNFVLNENFYNEFFLEDIFNEVKIKNCKVFRDNSTLHLNAEGNKIVAEFLWEKLQNKLFEKVEQPRQVVPALFSTITPPPTQPEYGTRTA